MELIIKNKVITEPIKNILEEVRKATNYYYLKDIQREKHSNIAVTCPWHKGGQEQHPSCFVFTDRNDPSVQYGFVKCFTCGKEAPLYSLVAECFNKDEDFGKEWLVENFGSYIEDTVDIEPEIVLDSKIKREVKYLDEAVLDEYAFYHPYLEKRHITFDVGKRFHVGWDKKTNSITFPIWDYSGGLIGITKRNIDTKRFDIPADMNKAVYLLNFIREDNLDTVYVCESQINALTLWSWGYPAVALLGTGSKQQYEILRKTNIHNYILCLDGDDAGKKGTDRFIKNMNNDVFISIKKIPQGKDVNDLTKDEFDLLEVI